ncbi:microtubule-associated tumor suppressor 1 homolog A isoform X2 [Festucalex cinctus]
MLAIISCVETDVHGGSAHLSGLVLLNGCLFQNVILLPCHNLSMSNSTLNLTYNEFVVPHKDIHVCLPAESPYADVFLAPSLPNFSGRISHHSDGEAGVSPDINMPPTATLPDVCEKICLNSGRPYLGTTFTPSKSFELASEDDNLSLPKSAMFTPNGNPGGLQGTFVCEESPDHKQLACVESEPLTHFSGAFTPEKCITVVPSLSTLQDMDNDNQTSTPVLNIAKQMLPSLLESPCIESSPTIFPNEQQPSSITPPNRCAMGLPASLRKIKQIESALRNVNSKVMTGTVHKKTVSVSSPQNKRLHTIVLTKCSEPPSGTIRISPSKIRNVNVFVPDPAKRANNAQRRVNPTAAHLGLTIAQSSENTVGNGACKSNVSTTAMKSSVAQCSKASTEKETGLSQVEHSAAQSKGNQTFCVLSLEKSPDKSFQKGQKPTPKNTSNKTGFKLCPALRQLKTRLRCSSETLPSSPQPPKERRTISKSSSSITISRKEKQNKPATPNNSSQRKLAPQTEASKRPAASPSPRVLNKISLMTVSGRAKSRTQSEPSQNQPKGPNVSQPPSASPRPAPQSVGTPQSKQNRIAAGSQRNWGTREQASAARVKPQLSVSRPPATPCPSSMGPPSTPTSQLPRKAWVPSSRLNKGSIHSDQKEGAANTQVSAVAAHKQTPVKTKARVIPTPARWTGPILPTTNTPTRTNKGASASTSGPLKRTAPSRFVGLTPSKPEKNKVKTCSRQQVSASQAKQNIGPPDVVPPNVPRDDGNVQRIQTLGGLLAASNCRFEAVTVVLQQALAERDEAAGQCRELSQQLVSLRGELECSANSSQRLEKEKRDLQDALDCAMRGLREQHQKDLEPMEQRMQAYQADWDKVHFSYQEEADKCKALLEKQIQQLEVSHEAKKLELEHSHVEQLQCVEQQHEQSLEELRKIHTQQLQSLDASLKDSEAALSAQIEMLTRENTDLIEKLTAEEDKRRELVESQKDSHTVYLEQELESLKVVLDIKNKQLHQQKKKMIEIDELLEKNVKLDESLKKVQQENEDLKARTERYAALSRQLSTEQVALQESLQKESNVNKRLSRENEELLWKLQNGEPSSPQKASPSALSPSHLSSQSPHSSGACPAFPLSPR